jgi:hypothetical protein
MTLLASEVRVAITGEMFSAPAGTALPDDVTTPLTEDFIGHGYVDEDGIVESWDDSVQNITAWQNATVVRAARESSVGTFKLVLIQTRGSNLELYYPGSVVEANGAGEWKLDVLPANADPRVFVFNVVDGDKIERIVLGNAEVTERGDVVRKNGEPIGYEITVTLYPDDDGNLMHKYSNDEAWGIDSGASS